MNDQIKGSGAAVAYNRLYSGAKVKEPELGHDTPQKAVDSVVAGLDKAKHSIEKITDAATTRVEVIRQNETSTRTKVEDVDEAIRLSQNLELNIRKDAGNAKEAHSLNKDAIKELLR